MNKFEWPCRAGNKKKYPMKEFKEILDLLIFKRLELEIILEIIRIYKISKQHVKI